MEQGVDKEQMPLTQLFRAFGIWDCSIVCFLFIEQFCSIHHSYFKFLQEKMIIKLSMFYSELSPVFSSIQQCFLFLPDNAQDKQESFRTVYNYSRGMVDWASDWRVLTELVHRCCNTVVFTNHFAEIFVI